MKFLLIILCSGFLLASTGLEKVEPSIFKAFSEQVANKKKQTEGVRVVVHLNHSDARTFANRAAIKDVADAVLENQSNFQLKLIENGLLSNAESFAGDESGFRIAILLDYQHAIAGYVSDIASLTAMASLPEVKKIDLDNINQMHTVEGTALTGSDVVANNGWTGDGVGVAVIDSHFDLLHPELGGNTNLPNGVVFAGRDIANNNNTIHSRDLDECVHGTAVASIVRRYAPDADIYPLVVLDPGAPDSVVADAINWCITNRAGVNGGAPIRVINLSLGGGKHSGLCAGVVHDAAGDALNNDIVVLAASGNASWTSYIASPACSQNVIAVGATWDVTNANYDSTLYNCTDNNRIVDERTCYSNRSWKVNIYAPSQEVICASCGGGTAAFGGTSAATPAASGMVAQLLEMDNSFIGERQAIIDLFTVTGNNVAGAYWPRRRVNIAAAIDSCAAAPATPAYISGPNYDPCPNVNVTYQTPAVNNADEYEWEVGNFNWVMPGPSVTVYTGHLTPGWHTIRVRALNCAGVSGWRSQSIRVLSSSDPSCSGCAGRFCDD